MWKMDVLNQNSTGAVYALAAVENVCMKRNEDRTQVVPAASQGDDQPLGKKGSGKMCDANEVHPYV